MDSYMFRLINLHSNFSKANALKGLNEITKIAKLSDINRLKTTDDALVVACDIFEVILNNIDAEAQKAENKANGKKQKGNGNGQGQAQQAGEGEEEAGEDDIEVEMGDDSGDGDDGEEEDEKKKKEECLCIIVKSRLLPLFQFHQKLV